MDTQISNAIQNVISTLIYPNDSRGQSTLGIENRVGKTEGFLFKVGYRTGDHTFSSVPVTAEGASRLLFSGYFDQTDTFFKMTKTLLMNMQPLDEALSYKRNVDVPYFAPTEQFCLKNFDGTIWMKTAPLYTPRLITEEDHADHADEHKSN